MLSRVDLLSTSNSYDIFSSISISVSNSPPVSSTSNRMSDAVTLVRNNIGAIVNINSVLYENPGGLIDFICEKPIDDKNKYRLLIAHVWIFLPQDYVEGLDPRCFIEIPELIQNNNADGFNRLRYNDSHQTYVNILNLVNKRLIEFLDRDDLTQVTEVKLSDISICLERLIDPPEDRKW